MRKIFVFILFSASLLSAQSLVQLQQNPLLISASFTGSDSASRLCLAGQQYQTEFANRTRKEKEESQAYFMSFDRKTASGKSAWGGYAHYWDYTTLDDIKTDTLVYLAKDEWRKTGTIEAQKAEAVFNFVPRFWKIQLVKKNLDLIPSVFIGYSHQYSQVQEHQTQTTPYDMLLAGATAPIPANAWYSHGSKKANWNRVSVGSSILLRNQKFFVSYQWAFRFDQVQMSYSSHYQQTALETGNVIRKEEEEGTYKGLALNAANSISFGAYFPKRSNSLIQFVPMAVFTYNVNNLGDSPNRNLIGHYYVSNAYYDYTSVYGSNWQNVSLNGRIWKIVLGVNWGVSSAWTTMGNYYIGYKAQKWVATFGLLGNGKGNAYVNASLQLRLKNN